MPLMKENAITIRVGFVQGVIPFFCSALYPKCGPLQKETNRSVKTQVWSGYTQKGWSNVDN